MAPAPAEADCTAGDTTPKSAAAEAASSTPDRMGAWGRVVIDLWNLSGRGARHRGPDAEAIRCVAHGGYHDHGERIEAKESPLQRAHRAHPGRRLLRGG